MSPSPVAGTAHAQVDHYVGQLEGIDAARGLTGWATQRNQAAADEAAQARLVQITLEDLPDTSSRWKLADVSAHRSRPVLCAQGIAGDRGFVFLGPFGLAPTTTTSRTAYWRRHRKSGTEDRPTGPLLRAWLEATPHPPPPAASKGPGVCKGIGSLPSPFDFLGDVDDS